MTDTVRYESRPGDEGKRLDVVLSKALGISRTRLSEMSRSGAVLLEGVKPVKPSFLVRPGDIFSLPRPAEEPRGASAEPENIPLSVVYEDRHLLVIDKPAGMVVHPAPGHRGGTLVNALLAHVNRHPDPRLDMLRPGIVHRLDKNTSGLLVAALTFEAHESLSGQIRAREMSRIYRCLCWGRWPEREGVIRERLGRSRSDRKKITVLSRGGREAVTRYRVLESYDAAELVEAVLETGRTHQIRVHFANHGHPVVGDPEYGGRAQALRGISGDQRARMRPLLQVIDRQALHAHRLSFNHPSDGRRMEFSSPLPGDIGRCLDILRECVRQEGTPDD